MNLNAEPLRVVLSKVAPLEDWGVSWSVFGPKVCWRLFRPNPQQFEGLFRVISDFQGHARWHVVDGCLQAASPGAFTLPSLTAPAARHEREAYATNDLAGLASEIENRLDLLGIAPMSFSDALLTKEGLRKSRGPFEDFVDGGQRIAYLIVDPRASDVFEPTKRGIMLHFEPGYREMPAIFGDILGTNLSEGHGRALTHAEVEKVQKRFPVLWNISDYYADAYLSPKEAGVLLQECAALDKIVFSPRSLRGVDKLWRIAHWASEKHFGVLFSAP